MGDKVQIFGAQFDNHSLELIIQVADLLLLLPEQALKLCNFLVQRPSVSWIFLAIRQGLKLR